LGIVEGVTEYLPVSSTGHLIITAWLLGLSEEWRTKVAVDAFTIIIQGGAILAVLGLYRARVGLGLFRNLMVALLPAVVLGVLFEEAIEHYLFHPRPVILALFVGGVLLLVIGPWQRRIFKEQAPGTEPGSEADAGTGGARPTGRRYIEIEQLRWWQALVIGLLQCVAMWPGTSRSMMTIVGGMFLGLRPRQAAEFSFLLGLPTLGGACGYTLLKIWLDGESTFLQDLGGWVPLVVGLVVATCSAALAIHWLVAWLTNHGLSIFGWWRIGLSAVLLAGLLSGRLTITPPVQLERVNPKTLREKRTLVVPMATPESTEAPGPRRREPIRRVSRPMPQYSATRA
ncbi:MAG: undecaprenyl-diphosphate phosphatase, partial [Planctomycetota bacterium]|nr:undecaprenyl-diphosphate phosphatase [Planctomycetota bacterium]